MQAYLACFDITDDRSRRRVSGVLEEYGLRIQRSVFEISLESSSQLSALCKRLKPYLESGDDLRLYNLCAQCRGNAINVSGGRIADYPLMVVV